MAWAHAAPRPTGTAALSRYHDSRRLCACHPSQIRDNTPTPETSASPPVCWLKMSV